MSSDCCLAIPRSAMGVRQFVIVVFSDHTPLLFFYVHFKIVEKVIYLSASWRESTGNVAWLHTSSSAFFKKTAGAYWLVGFVFSLWRE